MFDFKSPMDEVEIIEAIKGVLKKIDGVYYSKHRSWAYFVEGAGDENANEKFENEIWPTTEKLEDEAEDEKRKLAELMEKNETQKRELAKRFLPLCVAHNGKKEFSSVHSFYKYLSEYGEKESSEGKMALRRFAEIYIDLTTNNWTTSNVLIKALEQFFSYSYENCFGSLLCCALMSGWYEEAMDIILPRIHWLGKESIGKFRNPKSKAQPPKSKEGEGRNHRILEFIAIWFDECAVNMLKGVTNRDPFNYYVFECGENQRLFFTSKISNDEKKKENNRRVGRRYAFLAALFYQLDFSLNEEYFQDNSEALFDFFWRVANCYANAAHTKEAVFYAKKAESCKDEIKKLNTVTEEKTSVSERIAFYGDMMNIYYLHERYKNVTGSLDAIMPDKKIEQCDKWNLNNKPYRSLKRKIIIFSASSVRFSSKIKAYKQGVSDYQRLSLDIIGSVDGIKAEMDKQFNDAINGKDKDCKQIIASFFARTIFCKDADKEHFLFAGCNHSNETESPTAEESIKNANYIEKKLKNNTKEKDVWLYLKAMVLLKYATYESARDKKPEESKTEIWNVQKEYLKAAWKALTTIEHGDSFLARTRFAINNLKSIEGERPKTFATNRILKTLLYVYMTFRIQDILSVAIHEVKEMGDLCIYTTAETMNKWLSSSSYRGCPLTMMNTNYFNDPLEGMLLPCHIDKKFEDAGITSPKVFLKSFTSECDNIPMWDRYADNGKGICVKLDSSAFGRTAAKLNCDSDSECEIIAARVDDSDNMYRVAYCSGNNGELIVESLTELPDNIIGDAANGESNKKTKEEVQALVDEMKKLYKDIVGDFKDSDKPEKKELFKILKRVLSYYTERVAYLFKDAAYKSEKELRIISYDHDSAYELAGNPLPLIAVSWSNTVTFKEIMFGPRVTDAEIENYTPYIQHQVEKINRWKAGENDFKFTKSQKRAR